MIARDKNHPCIVMWSIANEPGLDGGGERPQQAYDYFRPLYELARINAEIDKRPWFIGEQLWNFAEFATFQGIIRVEGNRKGILTRDRQPKMAAHWLRERWAGIPDYGYKG